MTCAPAQDLSGGLGEHGAPQLIPSLESAFREQDDTSWQPASAGASIQALGPCEGACNAVISPTPTSPQMAISSLWQHLQIHKWQIHNTDPNTPVPS